MHKFRTMRDDAEDGTGAVWSTENDPRVTFIGRILRKFRLDELPQFWNILKGEMSLVGPRPERTSIVAELLEQIPFYEEREYAMPGLTGWAQIQYPYGATVDDSKHKLEYDLFYIKNLSLSLDLQIVLRTLRIVVLGKEKEH
jgi:lipopolysaccharide/colanic/teichoic acid biosynthesis glycosyltransferase